MPAILSDVILSNAEISANMRGKNMRLNSRVSQNNGYETTSVIWTRTQRQYEIGFVPMSIAAWSAIEAVFEVTEGGAYGFLIEDPKDYTVTTGVATAISSTIFQLQKRYIEAVSSRYKDRIITRPRAAGFIITNSGTPISGASYTLDVATGRITIPSAPTASNLAWTGLFYVPVNFATDFLEWEVERSGSSSTMLLAGPSVMLQEVKE